MRKATAALVLAIALALAVLPSLTSADQNVTIREVDFRLEPNSFTATAGEVVHFTVTNTGTRPHNVEVELESANVEKKLFDENLQPGDTRSADFTFTRAGTWEMYCPVGNHKAMGMTGQVTVLAAAAAPAPPAAPAQPAAAKPAVPAPAAVPKPAVPVAQPAPSPTPSTARMPSQLPRTGSGPALPIAATMAGLGLVAGGLLMLRRR